MPKLKTIPHKDFPYADSVALALANGHLSSEFKNYVILGCNDMDEAVAIDAHVDNTEMLFHLKNQFAAVCHALRTPNTDEEESA